jgi:hypothetical protein
LQQLLDSRPDLWRQCGDLAWHARAAWLQLIADNNLVGQEAMRRQLAALQAELLGPEPTPLERLLVERIGVAWLQVHHADLDAAAARRKDRGETPVSLHAQRRLESAQRRYLQALKQLAVVRTHLRPPVTPVQMATRLGGRGNPAPARHSGLAPCVDASAN